GEYQPPPMLQLLGVTLVEVEYGRVVFTATVEERFYNGTGVAHGGFAATLLDTAPGCAINTTTPPGRRFTTPELKVNLTPGLTTAVVTIDNPPVNALGPDIWAEIDTNVARAVADPAASAIVLIGAGTTFIAGADIKAFDLLKTSADSMTRSANTHALLKRVEDASKPLVAAIH